MGGGGGGADGMGVGWGGGVVYGTVHNRKNESVGLSLGNDAAQAFDKRTCH